MKYVVVVLAALATAQPAWATPGPLRVTAISPEVANRGELVTITGAGFGARNLEVSLDGERVPLVAATGSRASFRVPFLSPVGDVEVVAQNPGGITGRIGLRVRFDGNTVAVADHAAAVAVPVGQEGGTIEVEGMTLAVPADAVPEGTTIIATPLRSLEGSPFAAAPVGLKLEPSGLVLLQPATLTLPKPLGSGTLVGFGFNGDGEGFRLVPHRVLGDTVELKVWHFSGAGVLTARLAELNAVLGYEPTPAHELAEQRIAAALAQGLPPDESEVLIRSALVDWYQRSVRHGLQLATTGPVGHFELAFGEWQAWLAHRALYSSSSWSREITEAFGLARVAAGIQAGSVLDVCTGASGVPFTALRNLARLATAIELAALPIELGLAPDGRQLPSGSNLTGACVRVELLSATHATTLARNRDNTFAFTTAVVFWNGSPRNDLATRFELADATGGPPFVPLANATTSTGSWQTTVRPTLLGERRLDITAELSTSSDVDLSSTAGSRRFTVVVRERLDLQARRATESAFTDTLSAVDPGTAVTLRIRLAGDTIDNQTITFAHDGDGSLPVTATTNPSGEATVTYTAPESPGSELVTATITDAGLTSGDALVITTRDPIVVSITPSSGSASPGESVQFTATVTGSASTGVTWSATGGAVVDTGNNTASYEAGTTPGTFTVTATSIASPHRSATAVVTITGASSPGGRLVFNCRSGFILQICLMDGDGTNRVTVPTPGLIVPTYPAWSPSGTRIAFTAASLSDLGLVNHLYVMRADGSGLQSLARGGGAFISPTWSPDGSRIAFRHDGRLMVVGSSPGSAPVALTEDSEEANFPAWSPDGTKILYQSTQGSLGSLRTIRLSDRRIEVLIAQDATDPAWSPDGRKIAFTHINAGANDGIFVANADGSGATRLTASGANPDWSPDGTQIAFTSLLLSGIGIVDVASRSVRLISSSRGDGDPDWEPGR